jgi:TPR repeat protein
LSSVLALSAEEARERLSGSAEEVAAFIREATEQGEPEAQARLGQLLLDGNGVARDEAAALGWFVKAARAGHVEAINMVGRCYDLGLGTVVDKRQAAKWFRAAAERGLDWGMYNYATALALGDGVEEDKAEALALFRRAAAMGNAKAINHVGSFYEDGWVVRRDLTQAARCYRTAAVGGDFRGMFNHARMLADAGRIAEACAWFERSAASGNSRFRANAAAYLAKSAHEEVRHIATMIAAQDAIASH